MNPSTTALTLNMQLPNIATVSWAVQGDTLSREITATLVDGSTAWNPQAGYHGVIRAHKPDGTNCVYDVDEDGNPAVTWTGNVATVKIVQQALTAAGTVLMQLEFYDQNDARVTAFGWANNVQPSAVTDNEFLSSDYYNILTLQIAGVLGASSHPPYIDSVTKNWMIWDENSAAYVDSGYSSVGMTGPAPVVTNTAYQYANSNSGTTVPTSWSGTRPATSPGTWAWTKTTLTFDNDSTTVLYSAAYQGQDGQGSPGSSTPLMDGTAAVGSATAYSREDHVHPSDTSCKLLILTSQTLTGTETSTVITGSTGVKSNMSVVSADITNPDEMVEDLTCVADDGSLTVTGEFSSTGTTVKFYLEESSVPVLGTTTSIVKKVNVESGSNANGNYVKYPDGTLICWKTVKQSNVAITSTWGNAYESQTQASFGSWPYAFVEKPMVECTMQQESGTVTAFPQQISGVTTTSAGTTYAWSPRSQASATIIFGVMGIGRWKA